MTEWIREYLKEFLCGLIVVLFVTIMCALAATSIASKIENEANKINEGIVVDKSCTEPYTSKVPHKAGTVWILRTKEHPTEWEFTIKGEKNGKMVEYRFNVSESEYSEYETGDHYTTIVN